MWLFRIAISHFKKDAVAANLLCESLKGIVMITYVTLSLHIPTHPNAEPCAPITSGMVPGSSLAQRLKSAEQVFGSWTIG
jgi:hypothetical protein